MSVCACTCVFALSIIPHQEACASLPVLLVLLSPFCLSFSLPSLVLRVDVSAASIHLPSLPPLPPSLPPFLTHRGGNDVMSVKDNCLVYDARCKQQIAEAMSILADLLETMHKDGIQHVIFMG